MPPRAELLPGVAADPPVESQPNTKPAITANDGHAQLGLTARERERDARRRYQAAIAAASETLRRAEQRFDESSAAIDAHIQRALAAAADRGIASLLQRRAGGSSPQQSKGSAAGRTRSPSRIRSAPAGAAAPSLAPMPSRALP